MKDFSPEQFEAELRRQRPAAAPPELLRRLLAAEPQTAPAPAAGRERRQAALGGWRQFWLAIRWWLAPASAAVIVVAFLVFRPQERPLAPENHSDALANAPAVKADDVEIQSELVNSFDTIAQLPTGEPVRYRCREWVDEVTLRDRSRGLVLEQRTPRVEVIPVRFETY